MPLKTWVASWTVAVLWMLLQCWEQELYVFNMVRMKDGRYISEDTPQMEFFRWWCSNASEDLNGGEGCQFGRCSWSSQRSPLWSVHANGGGSMSLAGWRCANLAGCFVLGSFLSCPWFVPCRCWETLGCQEVSYSPQYTQLLKCFYGHGIYLSNPLEFLISSDHHNDTGIWWAKKRTSQSYFT